MAPELVFALLYCVSAEVGIKIIVAGILNVPLLSHL